MKYTTIVIGAGVSGLSAAFSLLREGHSVTVLDQAEPGREASWSGGGILSPLLPWDYPDAVTTLCLRSMRAFPDWVREVERISGFSAEWWQSGMVALDLPDIERAASWCKNHALRYEKTVEFGQTGLRLPTIGQVRNPRLIGALSGAIARMGGVVRGHCAVHSISAEGRQATGLETAAGPVHADRFVIATGAWAGMSLSGLAGMSNIRPIRGQMLLFKLAPGALRTIVYRHGTYLIPRLDGHVLVGSTVEDAGFDKSTDAATARRLHAEAARLLPQLRDLAPIRHWAGLRPGAPENIPVIDRHPDFDNVFVNTGHYRYGVTMAPASAELLVDLMNGVTPTLDSTPYSWQAALERKWTAELR